MAAVIADAETVRNIRWILGSILTDSVIDILGILLHLLGVDKVLDSELANNSLRTCKVYIYSSWFPRKSRRSADGYLLLYHYLCNGEMEELTSACKEECKLLHRHSCFFVDSGHCTNCSNCCWWFNQNDISVKTLNNIPYTAKTLHLYPQEQCHSSPIQSSHYCSPDFSW